MFEKIIKRTEEISNAINDFLSQKERSTVVREYFTDQSNYFKANLLLAENFLKFQGNERLLVIHCPSTEAMYEASAAVAIAGALWEAKKANLKDIKQGDRFKDKTNTIWTICFCKIQTNGEGKQVKLYHLRSEKIKATKYDIPEDRLLDPNHFISTKATTNRGRKDTIKNEWVTLISSYLGAYFNLQPSEANNIVIGPLTQLKNKFQGAFPISWVEGKGGVAEKDNQVLRRFGEADDAYEYLCQKKTEEKNIDWGMAFGPRVKQHNTKIKKFIQNKWLKKGILVTDRWLNLDTYIQYDYLIWPPLLTGKLRTGNICSLTIYPINDLQLENVYDRLIEYAKVLDKDHNIALGLQKEIQYKIREITDNIKPDFLTGDEKKHEAINYTFNYLKEWIKNHLEERDILKERKIEIQTEFENTLKLLLKLWNNGDIKKNWLQKIQKIKPKPIYLVSRPVEIELVDQIEVKSIYSLSTYDFPARPIIPTSIYLGNTHRAFNDLRTLLAASKEILVPCYKWEKIELKESVEKIIKKENQEYDKLLSNAFLHIPFVYSETIQTEKNKKATFESDIEQKEKKDWWDQERNFEPRPDYLEHFESPAVELIFENGSIVKFSEGAGVLVAKNKEWIAAADVEKEQEIFFYRKVERIFEILPESSLPNTFKEIIEAKKIWRSYLKELFNHVSNNLERLTYILTKNNEKFPKIQRVEQWLKPSDTTWFPALSNLETICAVYKKQTGKEHNLRLLEKAELEYNRQSIIIGKKLSQEVMQLVATQRVGPLLENLSKEKQIELVGKGRVIDIRILKGEPMSKK